MKPARMSGSVVPNAVLNMRVQGDTARIAEQEWTERRKTMEKHEVLGHCASCRFWMTTLSPDDRAEAARYENTDGVCDMFNEDGFSPNDYCSRWEAWEEFADKMRRYVGNKRTEEIDIPSFDKETRIENCTVQILENTETGEVSVGWWRNE